MNALAAAVRAPFATTPPRAFLDIVGCLDDYMAGDWSQHREQIAALVGEMSREHRLLGFMVDELAARQHWPRIAGAQSFIIYLDRRYYIRTNLWYPQPQMAAGSDKYRKYLSIGECHNHTYNFFTSTLFGSGYDATFYRADVRDRLLGPGDPIALLDRRERHLGLGEVMLVERDHDFHIQHWPSDFSVTVNVVPLGPGNTSDRQYIVDPERGVVLHAINATMAH